MTGLSEVVRLDSRRQRLGGSTIGAAIGVDPYCSPIRLWLEMTGRVEREQTEAMGLGKRLEPVIFDELEARGFSVRRTPGIELHDPLRAWIVGHPDGVTTDTSLMGIVEAKASARGSDTLPPQYEAQAQLYAYLALADEWMVAQLAGLHLTVWAGERNPGLVEAMLALAEPFMECVRSDTQPAPSSHPDDRAALALAFSDVDVGAKVRETRAVRDARRELRALLDAEKARKQRIEHLRAVVTNHMGHADTLVSAHDEVVATWKNVTARRLDTDALKRQVPNVYEAYATETTSRRLVLA